MTDTDKTAQSAAKSEEKPQQQYPDALIRAINEAQAELYRMTIRSGWRP